MKDFSELVIVTGEDALSRYFSLPAGAFVGYDIETMPKSGWEAYKLAGLDPHTTDIRLVQFYTPNVECLVIDLLDFPDFQLRTDLRYAAHFSIFELMHSRMRWGDQNLQMEDTLLMEQLIFPIQMVPHTPDEDDEVPEEEQGVAKYKQDGYTLANAVYRHFKVHMDKSYQNSRWSDRELSLQQIQYAALDAYAAYHLAVRQIQIIKKEGMFEIYKLQRQMLHVVADMQITGICVDWEAHAKLLSEWKAELEQLNLQCKELFKPIEYKGKKMPVNVNSSIQLGIWLNTYKPELLASWPRTAPSKLYPQGNLQFGSKILPDYAAEHPEFAVLLRQKKLQKMVSSFGESLIEHKNPVTGRIHPTYRLGSTSTGRMSCNNPNLQQSPKEAAFRNLFVTPKDYVMVGGDFNQIEVQVQGQLSNDDVIVQNYAAGEDIYMTLAKQIFAGKEITKTSKERQVAKQLVLSLGYGMGAKKFQLYCKQAGVLITEEEAHTYHKAYHNTFSTYSQWCSAVRTKAEISGEAVTQLGKRRKLASDKIYTQAPNLIVQGTASELLQLCMVKLRSALRPYRATIIAAIHDEILLEVYPQDAESVKTIFEMCAREAFEELFPHHSKDILEAKIGNNWANVK